MDSVVIEEEMEGDRGGRENIPSFSVFQKASLTEVDR